MGLRPLLRSVVVDLTKLVRRRLVVPSVAARAGMQRLIGGVVDAGVEQCEAALAAAQETTSQVAPPFMVATAAMVPRVPRLRGQ